jgi:hypothetical protein
MRMSPAVGKDLVFHFNKKDQRDWRRGDFSWISLRMAVQLTLSTITSYGSSVRLPFS